MYIHFVLYTYLVFYNYNWSIFGSFWLENWTLNSRSLSDSIKTSLESSVLRPSSFVCNSKTDRPKNLFFRSLVHTDLYFFTPILKKKDFFKSSNYSDRSILNSLPEVFWNQEDFDRNYVDIIRNKKFCDLNQTIGSQFLTKWSEFRKVSVFQYSMNKRLVCFPICFLAKYRKACKHWKKKYLFDRRKTTLSFLFY